MQAYEPLSCSVNKDFMLICKTFLCVRICVQEYKQSIELNLCQQFEQRKHEGVSRTIEFF